MKILHIVKKEPNASTRTIIELHKIENDVTTIALYKGTISFDKLIAAVFASDRVFCW